MLVLVFCLNGFFPRVGVHAIEVFSQCLTCVVGVMRLVSVFVCFFVCIQSMLCFVVVCFSDVCLYSARA